MKWVDKELCAWFSSQVCCEFCGTPQFNGCQCHHIHTRGAGQVDIEENLLALCVPCHNGHHYSNDPSTWDLLTIVSNREGIPIGELQLAVWRIRSASEGDRAKVQAERRAARDRRKRKAREIHPLDVRVGPVNRLKGLPIDEDGWVHF